MIDRSASTRAVFKVWLFCAVFLPLTLGLGFWQLDRAEQKQQRLNQSQIQAALPERLFSLPVGAVQHDFVEPFRSFRLRGRFHPLHVLLDNRTRDGKAGYEVLTPFTHVDGNVFWINRGWVRAGRYREDVPTLDTPTEETEISGYFYQSERPPGSQDVEPLGAANAVTVVRVQMLDWPTLNRMAQQTLGAIPALNAEFRLRDAMQSGALMTGWPVVVMSPQKHTGYAWQWFGLSFALLVLSSVATVKIRRMS